MYTLVSEHFYDFAAGRNEALLAEADRDSRRAIALDDRDANAWNARKNALIWQWNWPAAFEAFDAQPRSTHRVSERRSFF